MARPALVAAGRGRGGDGGRVPGQAAIVAALACMAVTTLAVYLTTRGGASNTATNTSGGDGLVPVRRPGVRTPAEAAAAAAAEDGVASLAWKAEVMDSLERLERLTKGVLRTSLEQQQTTLHNGASKVGTDCAPAVAAALASAAVDAPTAAAAAGAATAPCRRRNAVVGLAIGIDVNLLYRFVRSLREVAPTEEVDLVLFLDAPPSDDLAWLLDAYRVDVHRFSAAALPAAYRGFHPSSYRWIMIRDWMASVPAADAPHAVFLTDVRDTVFQGNPFTHTDDRSSVFYAFQEARPGTIAACGWNSGWVKDCFGASALQAVGSNVISCSGTSLATWAAARVYVDMLAAEIAVNKCERNGVDQGMHNYFVYGGQLRAALGDALKLVSNEDGWVATVQSMPTLQRNRAGAVVNSASLPYAVVHQYDRSGALKSQYERQFVWLAPDERGRK